MQQVCSRFVMDMTDARMGPEQRCKNCQFAKKEHNQTNTQGKPQEPQTGKVSDLAKKFSAGNQPVAPDPLIKQKFQDSVRNSVQMKKSQTNMHQSQNQQQNTNPSLNQEVKDSLGFKKSESLIVSKEPSQFPPTYERQNLQIVNSQEITQNSQNMTFSQKVQIPTEPPVQKVITQQISKPQEPLVKQPLEITQQKEVQNQAQTEQQVKQTEQQQEVNQKEQKIQVKHLEQQQPQPIKQPELQRPQQPATSQNQSSEIISPNKLQNNPFLKKDQNAKAPSSFINPEKPTPSPTKPQENGDKPLSFVQQQKLLLQQQQQQQQYNQVKQQKVEKQESPAIQNPKPIVNIQPPKEENKQENQSENKLGNKSENKSENKQENNQEKKAPNIKFQPQSEIKEQPKINLPLSPSTIKERANNLPIPVFGFGAPPKKPIQQKESESCLEQQMLDRPVLASKHKRTTQTFE